MTKKYFGTDGIRGAINSKNINGDMFFKFGLASGTYFKSQKKRKQTAIIAKDTRLSGYTLEPALVSGLTSAGMHVYTLGPLPTNGLAMLTKLMKANMGIMITASHNPHHDNGLKLFGPDGMKLSDKIEKKIENLIDKNIKKNLSNPEKLGRVKRLESGTKDYLKILKKNFSKEFNLRGLRIVIDCANGAGYKAGPELLRSLGAKVISIGINPNGLNINNNCGSTYPNKDLIYLSNFIFGSYVVDPSNEDDKFKRVKVRNFLKQLGLEGLDRNKFYLTIKNLKLANENIKFYVKKNLEKNVTILQKKENVILREDFFSQSEEVVFRSFVDVIKFVGKKYYPVRGK